MAKKKDEKTNVMRILDQKKVPYTPHFYEEGEGPEGTREYGVHVAQSLGQDPARAFKTLVARGASGAIMSSTSRPRRTWISRRRRERRERNR